MRCGRIKTKTKLPVCFNSQDGTLFHKQFVYSLINCWISQHKHAFFAREPCKMPRVLECGHQALLPPMSTSTSISTAGSIAPTLSSSPTLFDMILLNLLFPPILIRARSLSRIRIPNRTFPCESLKSCCMVQRSLSATSVSSESRKRVCVRIVVCPCVDYTVW